jgi:HSP20 family protein
MLLQQRNRVPFGALVDMSREMDRLVNSMWTEGGSGPTTWGMPAEIVETADELRIDVEVPGFREEDLEITLENNVLTIGGEKRLQQKEETKESDYRLFERRYGRFQRSFTVPATVRGDRCEASYENGVLTLRLPKAEEAKPRRIQIGGRGAGRQLEQSSQGDGRGREDGAE